MAERDNDNLDIGQGEVQPPLPPRQNRVNQRAPLQFLWAPPLLRMDNDLELYIRRFQSYVDIIRAREKEIPHILINCLSDECHIAVERHINEHLYYCNLLLLSILSNKTQTSPHPNITISRINKSGHNTGKKRERERERRGRGNEDVTGIVEEVETQENLRGHMRQRVRSTFTQRISIFNYHCLMLIIVKVLWNCHCSRCHSQIVD